MTRSIETLLPLFLLWGIMLVNTLAAFGQPTHDLQHHCETDHQWAELTRQWPELLVQQRRSERNLARQQRLAIKNGRGPYVIPTVFHIIHDNGAENLSDASIQTAIDLLNQSFANTGPYDPTTGENTNISFCLAQRTPMGELSTGIERIVSPSLTDLSSTTEDTALKNASRYDPTQYLNVWVVREICSQSGCEVAGYAYLPSAHGLDFDGIVVEARWLEGDAANNSVLTHEAGHYLGLYHTFQGGCRNDDCLVDGDQVCDTPPDQSTARVACSASPNSCTTDTNDGFATDQPDMFSNYMDYSDFACYNQFTQGQCERMHYFMEEVRTSLLSSPGCQSPCIDPITLAILNDFSQPVATGATLVLQADVDNATDLTWSVDGEVIGTNTAILNYRFPEVGSFTLTLEAVNDDPNCQKKVSVVVQVVCDVEAYFEASSLDVSPGTVVFFNNASQNAARQTWSLDGVTFSTAVNVFYQFDVPGVYEVQLIAANDHCTGQYSVLVTVADGGSSQTGLPIWPMQGGGATGLHTVDWRSSSPTTQALTALEGDFSGTTGVAFDPCGGIAFYTVHTGTSLPTELYLFAEDGTPLLTDSTPNGPGLDAVRGNTETQVVPVPGTTREWYIIYRGYRTDSGAPLNNAAYRVLPLLYAHVRLEGDGIITVLTRDQPLRANGTQYTYCEGLAVSRTAYSRTDEHFLYGIRKLSQQGITMAVDRWLITANGIVWDTSTPEVASMSWGLMPAGSFLELSPTEDRIIVGNRNQDNNQIDFWLFDINENSSFGSQQPLTLDNLILKADGQANDQSSVLSEDIRVGNIASTPNMVQFVRNMPRKMAGMEFSPNGRFLYLTGGGFPSGGGGFTFVTYLAQVDLETNPWTVRLQVQEPPEDYDPNTGRSCTQVDCLDRWRNVGMLEAAYNGLLYFTKRNASTLFVIPNPNSFMPQNLVPSDIDLSTPEVPNIDAAGVAGGLPDQVDGFNYLDNTLTQVDIQVEGRLCGGNCRDAYDLLLRSTDGSWSEVYRIEDCPTTITACLDPRLHYLLADRSTGINYPDAVVDGEVQYPDGTTVFSFSLTQSCEEICDNGIDDDGDGLIDCADPDVAGDCCCYQPQQLDLGPDITLCESGITVLDVGPGFASYLWSDFSTEQTATTAFAGAFGVTVTDACGNTQSDEVVVRFETITNFDIGNDTILCPSETIDFSLGEFLTYNWSPASSFNCDNCRETTFIVSRDTFIIATVSDENGCIASDTLNISLAQGTLTGYREEQACAGDSLWLGEVWITNDTLVLDTLDLGSCLRIDSVQYSFNDVVFTSADSSFCQGDTLVLFDQVITTTGSYQGTFVGSNGCDSIHTIAVSYSEDFTLNVPDMIEVRWGEELIFNATTTAPFNAVYQWSPSDNLSCGDCLQPSLVATMDTRYILMVSDPAGCMQMDTVQVLVDDSYQYYVPNAFSPNRDGVNDYFTIYGDDLVAEILTLEVYDRWGGQVYLGTNLPVNSLNTGWDGQVRGKPGQAGIYAYMGAIRLHTGDVIAVSGDVLLLR